MFVCQALFSSFFRGLFRSPVRFRFSAFSLAFSALSLERSCIIPQPYANVNAFFQLFSFFFRDTISCVYTCVSTLDFPIFPAAFSVFSPLWPDFPVDAPYLFWGTVSHRIPLSLLYMIQRRCPYETATGKTRFAVAVEGGCGGPGQRAGLPDAGGRRPLSPIKEAPGKKPGAPFYTVMVNPRPQPYRRRGQSPFSG